MRQLSRDGVDLSFVDVGKGAPPLVLVHDLASDHTLFSQQIQHFSATRRVVAVDLRSHGMSSKPESGYSVSDFADDVAWLCYELGVFGPVVIGHGFGGAVCLDLCARYPDLPAAVVTLASPLSMPESARVIAASILSFAGTLPDQASQVIPRLLSSGITQESSCHTQRGMSPVPFSPVPRDALISAYESCLNWDSESAARACRVPFTYIDGGTGVADLARLQSLCPQLTVSTVPGGHFPHLKLPDHVNRSIESVCALIEASPS